MSYIQGFLVAVPTKNKDAYRDMAAKSAEIFEEYGATVGLWSVGAIPYRMARSPTLSAR
jgi:Uncharacterized conserved protein